MIRATFKECMVQSIYSPLWDLTKEGKAFWASSGSWFNNDISRDKDVLSWLSDVFGVTGAAGVIKEDMKTKVVDLLFK